MKLNELCEFNTEFYKTCLKNDFSFKEIFKQENPHILIRNLKFGRVLFKKFPELQEMNFIYQDKKRNSSLFEHSLKCLEYCYMESDYYLTLIAAFLHDFGKLFTYEDTFKNHDNIGIKRIGDFLSKNGLQTDEIQYIRKILKTHVRASQYQRDPNWTYEAFYKFVRDTYPYTFEIIKVAKADKRASHDYEPFLKEFEQLKNKCYEIINARKDDLG